MSELKRKTVYFLKGLTSEKTEYSWGFSLQGISVISLGAEDYIVKWMKTYMGWFLYTRQS